MIATRRATNEKSALVCVDQSQYSYLVGMTEAVVDGGLEQCLHHPGEGSLGDQTVLVGVRVGEDLHQEPVQLQVLGVGHHGGLLDELNRKRFRYC